MTQENTPGSVQILDNLRIAVVPSGSNALSVAILTGGTTKLLTFSLQPDGFDFPIAETEIADNRLANPQQGSKPGPSKVGPIQLKYVYGAGDDVAKPLLVKGYAGTLVMRDSLPNATEFIAAQKADTLTFVAGAQRKIRSGDLQVIAQTLYVDAGSYKTDQTLVA